MTRETMIKRFVAILMEEGESLLNDRGVDRVVCHGVANKLLGAIGVDRAAHGFPREIPNVLRSEIDGTAYFLNPTSRSLMSAPLSKEGGFEVDEAIECYETPECPAALILGITLALQLLEDNS